MLLAEVVRAISITKWNTDKYDSIFISFGLGWLLGRFKLKEIFLNMQQFGRSPRLPTPFGYSKSDTFLPARGRAFRFKSSPEYSGCGLSASIPYAVPGNNAKFTFESAPLWGR
jgi:hypothetical protein